MSFCTNCGKPLLSAGMRCLHCTPRTSFAERRAVSPSRSPANPAISVSASARIAISQTLFIAPPNLASDIRLGLEKHNAKPLEILIADDPATVQVQAQQAVRRLQSQRQLKFICLIGDWQQIPPFKVTNPSQQCAHSDPFCITDGFYGCIEAWTPSDIFTAVPTIPVGRIPSSDVEVILRALLEAPPPQIL